MPDNVAELRAGIWNKKEYSKARGLYGRTLGAARRRQHRPGDDPARRRLRHERRDLEPPVRRRRTRAADGAGRARARRRRRAAARFRSSSSPTPGDAACARRRAQRPPRAERRRRSIWSTPTLLAQLKPGAMFINTARGEVVDYAALAAAVRRARPRVGLDVFANEPAAATAGFTDPIVSAAGRLRHASHRRVHRPGAGGDRRRDRPHRPQLQGDRPGAERRQPGHAARRRRTCSSSATAIVRACSRTSSTTCAAANLNVQETENIVFEGAEAAVARINLDGAPTPEVCDRIEGGQPRHPRSAGRHALIIRFFQEVTHVYDHDHPHLQLFRRPGGAAGRGARGGAARPRRLCPASACRFSRSATARRRSRTILAGREADIRDARRAFPSNYKVLFLQGGASLQFSMVPMNLLPAGRLGRLHRHRRVGGEGGQGGEAGRHGEDRRAPPRPRTSRACRGRTS